MSQHSAEFVYQMSPGQHPEDSRMDSQDIQAQMTREWEADPDRWLDPDLDPTEYSDLQDQLLESYPQAEQILTEHPLIVQAQLSDQQKLFLTRYWASRALYERNAPKPGYPRVEQFLTEAIPMIKDRFPGRD